MGGGVGRNDTTRLKCGGLEACGMSKTDEQPTKMTGFRLGSNLFVSGRTETDGEELTIYVTPGGIVGRDNFKPDGETKLIGAFITDTDVNIDLEYPNGKKVSLWLDLNQEVD